MSLIIDGTYPLPGRTQRIGLFGGTFDPVHQGHLQAAMDIKDRFDIETVYLIPAALPPHKPVRGMAHAGDRIKMIRLAISACPGLRVSDVELKRPGPSYTVDTVTYFKGIFPGDIELLFLLGVDAFFEIDTWKSFKSLLKLIPFVVMTRPDGPSMDDDMGQRGVEKFIRSRISDGYRYVSEKECFVHNENQPVYFATVRPVAISSTQIRDKLRSGRSIHRMVPKPVENYIINQGLYK